MGPTCEVLEANAPSRVNAFGSREDFGQAHFQVFARSRVHEYETELLFQTLRDEHFSRSEREEIA